MIRCIVLSLMIFVGLSCNSKAENVNLNTDDQYDHGLIIDNKAINDHFIEKATALYESGKYTRLEELTGQLMEVGNFAKLGINGPESTSTSYAELKKSTLVVALMYICDQCPDMHLSNATAFVIDKSGICVTNYHVFEKLAAPMRGSKLLTVMDYKGNILPIEKVLCASEKDDLAVFKVKTDDVELHPIKLSDKPAEIGDEMALISHPIGKYYEYSKGYATRYYKCEEKHTLRLSSSVPFAVSSSGGGIYNSKGEIVAVVSSTMPYLGGEGNHRIIQKINYETIPVSTLRKMVGLDQ